MSSQQLLATINAAFEEGNMAQTFHQLKAAFTQFPDEPAIYQAAADILEELEDEEADLFQKAVDNFTNFQAFYDLGYHFVELSQWEMACPFLARAFTLNPSSVSIAYEYALTLCNNYRFEEAKKVLLSVEYRSDFWTSYRLYLCEVLTNGDVATAKEFIRFIRQTIYQQAEQDADDKFALFKLNQLQDMIRRLEAVGKPEVHIRDAFFIQYGAAILSYWDYEAAQIQETKGKWNIFHPSLTTIRTVLAQLKDFVEKLEISFKKILYCSDRNSEIIARIIGKLCQCPCLPLSSGNFRDENSLIVAADASAFNNWKELAVIHPKQIVFAFNIHYPKESLICPDIIGLLSQNLLFPWEEKRAIHPETGEIQRREADDRNTQAIANEIAALSPNFEEMSNNPTFAKHLAFYQKMQENLTCKQNKGLRMSFMVESPV